MATALEICQSLEKHLSKDQPIELSFYHFCKHYLSPETQINLKAIDSYFRRVYTFEFWRSESVYLQKQIKQLLLQHLDSESLKDILKSNFLHDCQLLCLKHKRDWLNVIKKYSDSKGLTYNLIESDSQSLFVHYTTKDHQHIIQKLYPYSYISNGEIAPITTDEVIYFDQNMRLMPFQTHHIHINGFNYARFETTAKNIQMRTFKGYSLQPSKLEQIANIDENSKLYYTVKRFEALITGKTDNTMYQRLCDLLEKSLDLLKANHPEAVKLAFVTLERGKNAQQTTFPNDKLLQVLIKELSFHLNNKVEGNASHACTPE